MNSWKLQNGYVIYKTLNGRSNTYLVNMPNETVLVDTSVTRNRYRLLANIQKVSLTEPGMLFLTHAHFDHVANAAFLKSKYGCKILLGKHDASAVKMGFTELPGGTNAWGRFIHRLGTTIGEDKFCYKPFEPDSCIEDKSRLKDYDILVIPTPGHTAGSLSLVVNNEIALVGDTMFGIFRNSIFPPFANDIPLMLKSWKELLDTGCRLFLPGHGREIKRQLAQREYGKYLIKYG